MHSALRQSECYSMICDIYAIWRYDVNLPEFGELWRRDESLSRPRILLMEKDNRWPETALEDSGKWVPLGDLSTGDLSKTQTGITRVPIAHIKRNSWTCSSERQANLMLFCLNYHLYFCSCQSLNKAVRQRNEANSPISEERTKQKKWLTRRLIFVIIIYYCSSCMRHVAEKCWAVLLKWIT